MGDDTVEDEVPHCPKVTTPEAVEGFANLPPARLSAHPIVLAVTATEPAVVVEIDVVSCLRSAPAEGSVLPQRARYDLKRPAFLKSSGSSWVSGMGSFELVECPESDEARG